MNGKVYIINAVGDVPGVQSQAEKLVTGERVMCMDAKTGQPLWEQRFNVFLTDIVTNRLGWAPLTADPETKKVYAHTTAGFLVCFDGETGKIQWQHQLTEEFGRVTGYGGRVAGPICDSGLVIVGMVQGSWGSLARGANRFVAFDKDSGKVVWWSETPFELRGTYYSNPVIATIDGQRLLISGGADGGLHAFQVRTGKRIWSYRFSVGVINPSPVVVGNLVLCCHGEENPEGGDLGRVICVDASKVRPGKDGGPGTPELVWQWRSGERFGLASPATDGKYLYVPDDAAKLYCFDIHRAPTGRDKANKWIWKFNYGTIARGSPVVADNKVYIAGVDARFVIAELNGRRSPEKSHEVRFRAPKGGTGLVEVNVTPAIADGRVYLATRDEFFCIGTPNGKAGQIPVPKGEEIKGGAAAQLLIYPVDLAVKPGVSAEFQLRAFNSSGVPLPDANLKAEWSLPAPAPPKKEAQPLKKGELGKDEAGKKVEAPIAKAGSGAPPPLDGTIDQSGKLIVGKRPSQHGLVMAKSGALTATARVRVVPQIPYKQDFTQVPTGGVPAGWINAQGKYQVVEKDGEKVLFKVNTNPRPPVARAYAYMTAPNSTGYTIEADIMGEEKRGKLPDAGILANRYTLYLSGAGDEKGQLGLRLISWEALPRIDESVPMAYKSGTWYRMKLTVEVGDKEATVRGKVWERGQPEPANWSIEFKDPLPNREGAAALYGYVTNADQDDPGSEAYFDNVSVIPTGEAKK
jgi:outer membrane protein assembly factor BamB